MQIDLSFSSNLDFAKSEEGELTPLIVKGMSCKAGYIKNKDFIIPKSQLSNIARTLKAGIDGRGAYILKDHGGGGFFGGKSVDSLVGRITDSSEEDGKVFYKGKVTDKPLAEKIADGLVTASSVGLRVNKMICSICGREMYDRDCHHLIGEQYPDEKLHELAEPYLAEMDGIPTAAIIGLDIEALEQSIVLFPAIPEASVGFNFSSDSSSIIEEMKKKKKEEMPKEPEDCPDDEDGENNEDSTEEDDSGVENDAEPLVSDETFNKEIDNNNSDDNMTEIDFEALKGEIATLKTELAEVKTGKSDVVETLSQSVTDLSSELETAKAIIKKFTDAEEARKARELSAKVAEIKELRVKLELSEKDYANVSEDVLDSELSLLKSFSTKKVAGHAAEEGTVLTDEQKLAETKENLREMIFKRRGDGKNLKGIKSLKNL